MKREKGTAEAEGVWQLRGYSALVGKLNCWLYSLPVEEY